MTSKSTQRAAKAEQYVLPLRVQLQQDQPIVDPQSSSAAQRYLREGFAAVLASTCCLGPLVLDTLGISGTWIGNLTRLEPCRAVFIVVAVESAMGSEVRRSCCAE